MPPISFPKSLEKALLHYVKLQAYTGTKRSQYLARDFDRADARYFSKGIADLSELFTAERSRLKANYLDQPAFRSAYLLYFLPINFMKTCYVLSQFPESFWKKTSFRVLDIGSGPGTSSLAFLFWLQKKNPDAKVELHLIDQNKNILQDAAALLKAWDVSPMQVTVKTETTSLQRSHGQGHYHLIILNHVLNELVRSGAQERATWLLPRLQNHLADDGLLALLEPALKRPSRELMALRDHLIEEKQFRVLAPCLHQNICPMLAATHNDWCHFYIDWEEPEYLQELDRLIGNDNRHLKVAYLILSPRTKVVAESPAQLFRVVSNRMALKGKTELILCGSAGRIKISRLDRDISQNNHVVGDLRRGDVVELHGYGSAQFEVNGLLRLNRQSQVFKK